MNTVIKVETSLGPFEVRTRSPRRYFVVDIVGKWVVKRTDNIKTAQAERRKDPMRRVVYDRVEDTFR